VRVGYGQRDLSQPPLAGQAILLGMAVRSFWNPPERWQAASLQLQAAARGGVMLLGASISFAAIAASGAALLGAIAAIVVGPWASVSHQPHARACRRGFRSDCLRHSICGNSAIAAVAPVIGAGWRRHRVLISLPRYSA